MSKFKGFLALLAAAVIYASFSVFVRWLSQELGAYEQIGFRNVIALAIGIVAVLLTRQSFKSLKDVPKSYIFLYTITFPIAVVLYTLAILQTKIVTTIFGLYLGGLLTSLIIGVSFFKEKITKMKVLSLALATLGLISYVYPFDTSLLGVGFLLAILSGFFDALANSFRKYLSGKVDRFVLVVLQMIGGLFVAGALMIGFGQMEFGQLSVNTWLIGLVFGALLVAISYLTLVGFQNFDLNLGTVILSSELFFVSIFAFVFFRETSSFTELLGGSLIIMATVVANWTIKKEGKLFAAYERVREWLPKK